MKISIWRQFSSNHSNGFTVVGKFASEDDAKQAAERLSNMLEAIYLQGIGYDHKEPLQAELDIAKEFDIEWLQHLDWIHIEDREHVHQFENYVSITSEVDTTWQGAMYIDEIMAILSEEIYVENSRDVIDVVLSCVAPSVDVAKAIYDAMNPYLTAVRAELFDKQQKINPIDAATFDAYYGHIEKRQQQIRFHHLTFGEMGKSMLALLAYLKQHNCTDIEYTIRQAPMSEVYERD